MNMYVEDYFSDCDRIYVDSVVVGKEAVEYHSGKSKVFVSLTKHKILVAYNYTSQTLCIGTYEELRVNDDRELVATKYDQKNVKEHIRNKAINEYALFTALYSMVDRTALIETEGPQYTIPFVCLFNIRPDPAYVDDYYRLYTATVFVKALINEACLNFTKRTKYVKYNNFVLPATDYVKSLLNNYLDDCVYQKKAACKRNYAFEQIAVPSIIKNTYYWIVIRRASVDETRNMFYELFKNQLRKKKIEYFIPNVVKKTREDIFAQIPINSRCVCSVFKTYVLLRAFVRITR